MKLKKPRPLNVIGILVIGLILGYVGYLFGRSLLAPYGIVAFVVFALAVVVMCSDFFPDDSDKK
jgi:hypothetical protein